MHVYAIVMICSPAFATSISDNSMVIGRSVGLIRTLPLLLLLVTVFQWHGVLSAPRSAQYVKGFRSAEHVIIIGTDGFGSVYLENATSFLPNINRFFLEGATTTRARNKMRCESAPNWSSLITGMGPEESGIYNNDWLPPHSGTLPDVSPVSGAGKIPETMWRVAKSEDSSVVVAVAEASDWISFLVEEDVVNFNYHCKSQDYFCVQKMLHFIKEECPNLMFIHLESIDTAGHAHSWGSPEYYDAAKTVDGYIGEIMNAFVEAEIFEQTLFIIVSDHGGYGLVHEKFDEICIRIPILLMGPKVKQGYNITGPSRITDVAPTALNALGLHAGKYMVGNVLEEIYN